ncbi:MAG TPA: hypothetical protein VEA61_03640 [Allosphingosinicella sp.]|nr:hypothetical protein [Allosphingosinicella sp.]
MRVDRTGLADQPEAHLGDRFDMEDAVGKFLRGSPEPVKHAAYRFVADDSPLPAAVDQIVP